MNFFIKILNLFKKIGFGFLLAFFVFVLNGKYSFIEKIGDFYKSKNLPQIVVEKINDLSVLLKLSISALVVIFFFWWFLTYLKSLKSNFKEKTFSGLEKFTLNLASFLTFYILLERFFFNAFCDFSSGKLTWFSLLFSLGFCLIVFVILMRLFVWTWLVIKNEDQKNSNSIADEPIKSLEELEKIDGKTGIFKDLENKVKSFSEKLSKKDFAEVKNQALVYCLDASWGAGKTSFIQMVKNETLTEFKITKEDKEKEFLQDKFKRVFKKFIAQILNYLNIRRPNNIIWIDYNPWHFNNNTELIQDFFNTLEQEIAKMYGGNFGRTFQKYGNLITPYLEDNLGILKVVKNSWNSFFPEKTLIKLKEEIKSRLAGIDEKVVIVLDDIDRLEPEQVMLVMRLVKVISDFPKIIFILPMDYDRVSKVIVEKYGEQYRNYLQKIVNFKIKLPEYSYVQLERVFVYQTNKIITNKDNELSGVFENYVLKAYREQIRETWVKRQNFSAEIGDPPEKMIYSKQFLFFNRFLNGVYLNYNFSMLEDYINGEDKRRVRNEIHQEVNQIITKIAEDKFESLASLNIEIYKIILKTIKEISSNERLVIFNEVEGQIKSIIIQTLLTPRDIKHFASKLIEELNKEENKDLILNEDTKLNKIIEEVIETQNFPSL